MKREEEEKGGGGDGGKGEKVKNKRRGWKTAYGQTADHHVTVKSLGIN